MASQRSADPRSPSRIAGPKAAPDVTALVLAICHEVGNLLAAARLAAHLAGREPVAPDTAPVQIEDLAAEAGALLAQIRPLLARRPARTRVAPEQLLKALERALADRAHGDVRLEVKIPRSLPDVDVDPDAFYHGLLTLALGALEATRPQGRVRVFAQRADGGVGFVVEDDGPPSDPEGSPSRGRGLALELVRRVARRCGGRATRRPRRRGTRIEVWLAAAKPARRASPRGGRAARRGVKRPGAARTGGAAAAGGPAAGAGPTPGRRRPARAARSR